jgi:hypothetical protein
VAADQKRDHERDDASMTRSALRDPHAGIRVFSSRYVSSPVRRSLSAPVLRLAGLSHSMM